MKMLGKPIDEIIDARQPIGHIDAVCSENMSFNEFICYVEEVGCRAFTSFDVVYSDSNRHALIRGFSLQGEAQQ